jgi:hypothetical protein
MSDTPKLTREQIEDWYDAVEDALKFMGVRIPPPEEVRAIFDLALAGLDATASRRAVLEMQERAAKVCDDEADKYHRWSYDKRACLECAAAIRSLATEKDVSSDR